MKCDECKKRGKSTWRDASASVQRCEWSPLVTGTHSHAAAPHITQPREIRLVPKLDELGRSAWYRGRNHSTVNQIVPDIVIDLINL